VAVAVAFFFSSRRRHTRSLRDWSSDVCSSDLVGGSEHAVLHLLYARFWHKVLFDVGVVTDPEPFLKLVHQGIILGMAYRYYAVRSEERRVGKECRSRGSARL